MTFADDRDASTRAVLFVCTANVCRSPLAEHLMRHEMGSRLGGRFEDRWVVRSAGTHAMIGAPIHGLAREALLERGVAVPETAARQLTPSMIERADLVLTSTRAQRAMVAQLLPAAVRRTFTLRQFARLSLAGAEIEAEAEVETRRGHDLLERAALGRTRVQPVDEADDAVEDPIGKDLAAFRRCADLTARCIDAMLRPFTVSV